MTCVEGNISLLFFILMRPMRLMTMQMFIFMRYLYNQKLLP